jgi:hypothetical protein
MISLKAIAGKKEAATRLDTEDLSPIIQQTTNVEDENIVC